MTSPEGKVAVVTGASRGVDAAVARQLADQGVRLGLLFVVTRPRPHRIPELAFRPMTEGSWR